MKNAVPARLRGAASWAALAVLSLVPALPMLSGCHHRENASQVAPPQAMPPQSQQRRSRRVPAEQRQVPTSKLPGSASGPPSAKIPVTPVPPGGVSEEDLEFVATHRPILSEVGVASWYTADRGRKAANGEVFDGNALTAAHRTLPMGTLIVVTNMKTGQSSAMRISDRGPFVADRMIDLTIASARAVGVYQSGLARVRLDVYQTPKPINTGGRWCVQIGAFHNESDAIQLKAQLLELYPTANVIEFPGENSFWVRIRPAGDDRAMAASIARQVQPVEGDAYLTRLD